MIHPALDKPYIQLICNPYEHSTSVNTRVTIEVMQKDLSRDDMIEVFEGFMKWVVGVSVFSIAVLIFLAIFNS